MSAIFAPDCIDDEVHCEHLYDAAEQRCCHCLWTPDDGVVTGDEETLFDPGPEQIVRPQPPRVVICSTCSGRAYSPRREENFDRFTGSCVDCKGSGVEGMSAREAYLREFPPAIP